MDEKQQSGFHYTNLDQVIFPRKKITKKMVLNYYQVVFPCIIAHIINKPLMLHRFLSGIDHQGSFESTLDNLPSWISKKKIGFKDDLLDSMPKEFLLINSLQSFLYLIDQSCLTPYYFLHSRHNLYYPDLMTFVLEKSQSIKFNLLSWAAHQLRSLLESYGVTPFGMIGLNKSIIVVVPLLARDSFKQVRICAFNIGKKVAQEYPQYITVNPLAIDQKGVFINTYYNRIKGILPAPYSLLPERFAPVAIPFFWGELSRLKPERHTIFTVENRLKSVGDPWKLMRNYSQSLFNFLW